MPCLKLQIRYIDPWELINFEKSDCKTFFSVIIVSFAWSVAKPPNNRWEMNHFSFNWFTSGWKRSLPFASIHSLLLREMTYFSFNVYLRRKINSLFVHSISLLWWQNHFTFHFLTSGLHFTAFWSWSFEIFLSKSSWILKGKMKKVNYFDLLTVLVLVNCEQEFRHANNSIILLFL